MHSKSGNIEIVIKNRADEVIEELLKSLQNRYQDSLEVSMEGSLSLIMFIYCIIDVIK